MVLKDMVLVFSYTRAIGVNSHLIFNTCKGVTRDQVGTNNYIYRGKDILFTEVHILPADCVHTASYG